MYLMHQMIVLLAQLQGPIVSSKLRDIYCSYLAIRTYIELLKGPRNPCKATINRMNHFFFREITFFGAVLAIFDNN